VPQRSPARSQKVSGHRQPRTRGTPIATRKTKVLAIVMSSGHRLANGSSALPSRNGLTQAYAPPPAAASIRAALHVAVGIRRLIAIDRAFQRTAEMAIPVSNFPTIEIDDHVAPRLPNTLQSKSITATKFRRICCRLVTADGENYRDPSDWLAIKESDVTSRRVLAYRLLSGRCLITVHKVAGTAIVQRSTSTRPRARPACCGSHSGRLQRST
jgi:hypothetical protein